MPTRYKKKGSTRGRPPRLTHYEPGKLGPLVSRIGGLCEDCWRADDKRAEVLRVERRGLRVVQMRVENVGKRPRTRKQIIKHVAKRCGETEAMVERLWDEYRQFERDIRADADREMMLEPSLPPKKTS